MVGRPPVRHAQSPVLSSDPVLSVGLSSNGRTPDSGSGSWGSNPCSPARGGTPPAMLAVFLFFPEFSPVPRSCPRRSSTADRTRRSLTAASLLIARSVHWRLRGGFIPTRSRCRGARRTPKPHETIARASRSGAPDREETLWVISRLRHLQVDSTPSVRLSRQTDDSSDYARVEDADRRGLATRLAMTWPTCRAIQAQADRRSTRPESPP